MCQCPMTGFFISTVNRMGFVEGQQAVSMPYDGLFSFLLPEDLLLKMAKGVNALWRAFFISTGKHGTSAAVSARVNALWRAFFISTSTGQQQSLYIMRCQCPMTGFFHFYDILDPPRDTRNTCVNALWRAFFISTKIRGTWLLLNPRVSMPYDGLFSFLRIGSSWSILWICGVSMPYDGLFSFLR